MLLLGGEKQTEGLTNQPIPNKVDPLRKIAAGDPDLAAYSEHGELLQTVTEALAKLNKLSPKQTANALG